MNDLNSKLLVINTLKMLDKSEFEHLNFRKFELVSAYV